MNTVDRQVYAALINDMSFHIHLVNVRAGWWTDPVLDDLKDPKHLKYIVGTKLGLVHSEISEAMEGYRRSLMDDKVPTRPSIEVELADAFIRIFDLAGCLNLDLGGAIIDKLAVNEKRADHKPEERIKEHGKKF